MTTEQKYAELLKEVGELLHDKNNTIIVQKFQIDELKRLLKEKENIIAELGKETKTNE